MFLLRHRRKAVQQSKIMVYLSTACQNEDLAFWVTSQSNIVGICSNMAYFKACVHHFILVFENRFLTTKKPGFGGYNFVG